MWCGVEWCDVKGGVVMWCVCVCVCVCVEWCDVKGSVVMAWWRDVKSNCMNTTALVMWNVAGTHTCTDETNSTQLHAHR